MILENVIMKLSSFGDKKLAREVVMSFAKRATDFQQYDEVAKCFFNLKDYINAIIFAEKALALCTSDEMLYACRMNLINLYNHANYPEIAMYNIELVEKTNPDDIDNILEKAFSLFLLNRKDEAESILRKYLDSIHIDDDTKTKIRFNLGTYELYRDEFHEGLKKFLFEGRKLKYWNKPVLDGIFWDGSTITGETLVVVAEAGIGDEFINVRWVKRLEEMGITVFWLTDRSDISEVFTRNGIKCIDKSTQITGKYYWTHSMDLPIYLNLTYSDLWNGPYIKPKSSTPLKNNGKFNIGIRWSGNPEYDQDLHRSVPLSKIVDKLFDLDVNLFSLQRDTNMEELDDVTNITDLNLTGKLSTFEDTLSSIAGLDLVITSCTSIAHASASMGKETIVLVPISAYYIWSHSTEKSPWYGDNVTILRQEKPRSWDEPLSKLETLVQRLICNKNES